MILGIVASSISKEASEGYLLDDYTNSVGAYSLQKIRTGATYAVQVQRSSDDATTDVELEDAGSITLSSTVSAGGMLGTWASTDTVIVNKVYDQDGSNDLVQATDSLKGTLIDAGTLIIDSHGNTSILFSDNATDRVGMTMTYTFTSTNATVFFSTQTTAADLACIKFNGDTSSKWFFASESANASGPDSGVGSPDYYANGTIVSPDTRDGLNDAFSQANVDTGAIVDLDLSLWTAFKFGEYPGSAANRIINHYFNELIIFDSDESSNRTAIEADITSRHATSNYYTFDGTADSYMTTDLTLNAFTGDISTVSRVWLVDNGDHNALLGDDTGTNYWILKWNNATGVEGRAYDTYTSNLPNDGSEPYGAWVTYVHTVSSTESKLYKNGTLVDTDSTYSYDGFGGLAGTQYFQIGASNELYMLEGKITDVQFYNKVLSQAEVTSLQWSLSNTATNLVANFAEDKTGTTWTSEVGSYTATNQGGVILSIEGEFYPQDNAASYIYVDAVGLSSSNSTITTDASNQYDERPKSIKIVGTGGTYATGYYDITGLTNGATYEFTCWCKVDTNSQQYIHIAASGGWVSTVDTQVDATTFTKYTFQGTTDATTGTIDFRARGDAGSATDTLWVGLVTIREV